MIVFSWAILGAEATDAGPEGFNIGLTLNVNAKPDDVYRKLVDEVQVWWDPNHTFSGDSSNLNIDDRPGGCFCEKLENGAGVRHLTVVNSAPARLTVGPEDGDPWFSKKQLWASRSLSQSGLHWR